MATDSTNLPQGETTVDAGMDMTGSDLDLTMVQEAAATDPKAFVDLPKGNTVILLPVQPGQTIKLPTDTADGVLAKIGPEGNLALVVDGRTIILQGYLKANDQTPIKIVTNDGDNVDVADLIAATDPSLDIQTAAGPATGDQGDTDGSGIYVPFLAGPGLGGIGAEGILDPTALQYRLIDDERKLFTRDVEDPTPDFTITFDVLGGIVNEDDLGPDLPNQLPPRDLAAKLVFKEGGNSGEGNDPFDGTNYDDNDGDGTPDESDFNGNNADPDREPLFTVATVNVDFHGDIPGTLAVDLTKLPSGLTSEGRPIVYEVIPADPGVHGNGIVAFVDLGGTPGVYDKGVDDLVFTVEVDKDKSDGEFNVKFTLWDNIDNEAPDQNGDGSPDLLGADEQLLGLPVHFKITDSNGDSVGGTLPIKVVDDRPFFGEAVGVGEDMVIVGGEPDGASVTHDETKGQQSDDGADDVSLFDLTPFPTSVHPSLPTNIQELATDLYHQVVTEAGFSLPYGDSVGALLGIAQSQVKCSFGADGATKEHFKADNDPTARDSVFGAISGSGENERPFELFMIDQESVNGTVPVEDNKSTVADEGNLTAEPQKTNLTVTWNGEVLPVWLIQIDANTIVGYIETGEVDGPQQTLIQAGIGAGKEAVLVIDINDAGVLSFFQLHQLNHPDTTNGDEPIQILAADGETPLIYVRATDYDGDHAVQPVTVEIQDDKPVFCKVDWGCDNDSKYGVGQVDEDKLQPNGNNDWAPGDDNGGKHADGEIIFNFGADKPGHLEVSNLTVKDSAGVVLMNLSLVIDPNDGSIDVSGANNLKTADGEPITLVATLDAGTGLLTIVGNDAGGNPAFTFTLQTNGGDIGEFDFCLNQALYHPYTDLDSKNDGPLKAFEDNLKFDFTVVGKDVDGDSATGHIKVNVDDDSPKAECDVDCVTEGKTDGELNTATGNVVTGNGATIFGNDANSTDGNADAPGADQPYTISKLAHGGNEYVLVDNGDGTYHVEKGGVALPNSGDESFDGKILHIPTQEGGTLDIVLVSNIQSEVGDYQYTVPENAQHDHDIHAGPETVADSATGAFNTLTEFTDSFSANGITIVPIGGNLEIKSVNFPGGTDPDYRGVGVENFEGDEIEVDRGGNEGLRLNLASSTNNIELTIGALFNGIKFDNGHQEILQWEAWNGGVLIASGQTLGTFDGIATVDIDTLLPFDHVILKPIDNGQGFTNNNSDFVLINAEICCPTEKFQEQFDYTLRDADGDEACATLKIDVKDTEPTFGRGQIPLTWFVVDEDGLPTGVGNTNSPLDNDEDHSAPNAPVDDAKHIGTIPFTPGADPVSIELTVLGGPDTGVKTLAGQSVLAAWDPTLKALIGYIAGTDPDDAANQVFKMTVTNEQTGAYTFELLQPVKHPDTDAGFANDTENLNVLPNFVVVAEIEDQDCDVIFSAVKVYIDDDMPIIVKTEATISLNVDETLGGNGTDYDDPFNANGPKDGSTIENDEALTVLPPSLTNPAYGTVIGADGANGASLFTFKAGADGLQSAVYGLKITGGGNTGLFDTETGNKIVLVQNGSIIEGRADDGNSKTIDPVVFAFTVDPATGEVSMAQYRAINHGTSGDEGEFGAHDEVATMASGKLSVTLTVTDKDGDTVSASKDISGAVTFDDDGPVVTQGTGSLTLALDETVSKSDADYDDPNFPNGGTQDGNAIEGDENFVALPASLSGYGAAIGAATGSAVSLFSVNAGSDKLASATYTLQIGNLGATGLTDTATGTPITLHANGAVVEGKDGLGNVVFAISIDQATGQVTVAQFRAIDHGDEEAAPGAHDEVAFLGQGALLVNLYVVDKDGDSDSESVDISRGISFDDDGPQANCDVDCVTEGKNDGALNTATGNVVTGVNPENAFLGTDANGTDGNADNPGVDGPYTISKLAHGGHVYTLSADGTTVLKDGSPLGGGDSFDGKTLKITTAEGGTFEITMVSPTQAEVGEYRYTVPADADHDHDKHFGPESLAETRSAAFDTTTEWLNAFQADGITIERIGGTGFAIKNIDVNPKAGFGGAEDYRGIGISGGIDGAEVDTQRETMQLHFATPTDNAAVLLGAFFDGTQFDAGFQEIIQWKALAADGVTVIASGQILGADNGLVTLDVDTNGVDFTYLQLTPLNNGAGSSSGNNSDFVLVSVETCCPTEKFQEQFEYTLRDGDGDESSATLKIDVKDTQPTVSDAAPLCLLVDEDGLPAGVGNSDSPADAPGNSAHAIGNIPFAPGADPVTIELSVGNGGDTGLKTLAGQAVFGAWDAESNTLIGYIAGTDPSDAANQIFKMTVTDAQTGAVTFDLLKPIQHANTDQAGDNTENYPDPVLTVNVEIEDKDCDVAYTTVHVKIDDDMPVIGESTRGQFRLATDETVGGGADVSPNPGNARENDEAVVSVPAALQFATRIGAATADAENLFTFNAGADGLQSTSWALTVLGTGATGLIDTQTNTAITLVAGPGGIILGKANGGTGDTVFAFHIDGDGDVTMAQYRAVNHGADANNHDSEIFMAGNALGVIFSVTDKDGDTATATKDISSLISIDDDGPKFKKVDFDGDYSDKLDEDKLPVVGNNDNAPGDDQGGVHTQGTIEFDYGSDKAGKLSVEGLTVTDSAGNTIALGNLHTANGDPIIIDKVVSAGDTTWTAYVDLGGGKPGDKVFSLSLDTEGGEIGEFEFDLYQALEHPYNDNNFKNNGPDTTYEDNLKFDFTIKATDGDTDSTTGHLTFNIDDDSPNADKVKIKLTSGEGGDSKLVHDETAGVQNNGNGSGATDPDASGTDEDDISPAPADFAAFEIAKSPATALGYAQTGIGVSLDASGSGDAQDAVGADRPGTVDGYALTNSSGGSIANATATNLFDTATGNRIFLYTETVGSETFVVGRVGTGTGTSSGNASASGAISFALHTSEGGTIEVGQYRAIKHPDTGSDDDAVSLLNSAGNGAVVYVTVTVTDADGDSVKVTKPLDGGTHGAGSIVFQDDGPTANADVDSVKEAGPTVATGNVITGVDGGLGVSDANGAPNDGNTDTVGADGLKSITWTSVVENGAVDYIQGKYGKLNVDANGNYKYELDLTDPDTQALTKGQIVQEVFNYTIEDKDGDKASTTLTINVEGSNEPPHIDLDPKDPENDDRTAAVSDEGLKGGNPDSDPVPTDDTNDATYSGQLKVSDPDLPGDTLTVAMQSGVFPAWTFSDGQLVTWTLVNDHLLEGRTPDAQLAISVEITPTADPVIYDYKVTLSQPLDHPDKTTEDELQFDIQVRVTDASGQFDEATLTVQVEDDKPVIRYVDESLVLGVDESVGGNTDAGGVSFPTDGGNVEGDEAGAGALFTGLGTVIGYDSGNGAALFSYSAGGDLEDSHTYGLKITNGGVTSVTDTQTGEAVKLVEVAGVIQGRTVGSDELVFAFTIDAATGAVEMAQYRAVDHGTDQPVSYPDEVTFLSNGNPGVLSVTLEVVDKDGDKATAERDISASITIDDAGPSADLSLKVGGEGDDNLLVHDETKGVQNHPGGAADPDQSVQDEDDVASRPSVFAAFEDTDHPTLKSLGYASTAVSILNGASPITDAAYGSDGPGTTAIELTDKDGKAFDGDQTNLRDTVTTEFIFLFTEGDLVVGRVGADAIDAKGGEIAFALSIDGDSIDVAQYRAILHPDTTSGDDSVALLSGAVGAAPIGLVYATITVTDKDGDSISKSVSLDGQQGNPGIVFQDDGPSAVADTDSVKEGTGARATGNVLTGIDGGLGETDGNSTDGNADSAGVDGLKSITWTGFVENGANDYVQGDHGKLFVDDKGNYRYEMDLTDPFYDTLDAGETFVETFNYTIKDGDDDTSSTTLKITVEGDAGVTITDLTPQPEGDATVYEKGLAIRGSEPAGSGEAADGNGTDNDDTSESANGTFKVNAPDGVDDLTIGGKDVIVDGVFTATTITTPLGNELKITGFDAGTGVVSYTFTLLDNETHGGDGTNLFEDLGVFVSDKTGDIANGTLSLKIVDDVADAKDDTDSVAAGTYGPETGNVITGVGTTSGAAGADVTGADGALITKITNFDGSKTDTVFDGGVLEVAGKYGTLKIEADGDYTYTRNAGTPGGVQDVFNYTLTDGDGDVDTAKLTIDIKDSGIDIFDLTPKTDGDTVVDEKGLPNRGGEPAGSGEFADKNAGNNSDTSETNTGTFKVTAADGVGEIKVGSSVVFDGTTFTSKTLTSALGELTITGYNTGTGVVSYTYTLKDNADHTGGNVFDDFLVSVKDIDGDTDSDTLSVKIIDDVPTARPDTDSVTEDAVPNTAIGNVITGVDTNEGANGTGTDSQGADNGLVSKITGAGGVSDTTFSGGVLEVAGKYGTLTIEADGDYTYTLNNANTDVNKLNDGQTLVDEFTYRLTDSDTDTSDSTLKITINGKSDSFLPTANDDNNNAVDVNVNYQLMLVLDRSGSMDEIVPNSGGKTRFEVARDSLIALIEKFQGSTSGTVSIKLVLFNNTSDFAGGSNASTFISADAAIAYLSTLAANFGDNGTDYDAALWDAKQGIDDASWVNGSATTVSRVYWVSDGRPTNVGNSTPENSEFTGTSDTSNQIQDNEQASWEASLNAKGVKSIAIGIGSDIVGDPLVDDQLARVAHDPNVIDSGFVQIIDDINALTAALIATVPGPVNGNLLGNDTAGDPSDPLTGGVISIVDLADAGSPVVATVDGGTKWIIDTALGTLEVIKATGAYTYTPKPGSEGKTDTFQYTIQDTINSDQDTAVLSISIQATGSVVNGTGGDDTKAGGLGADTINGGNGIDVLWGGEGNDIVNGDAGNDRLYGGAGNDSLNGGADNDTYVMVVGDGKDVITDTGGTADSIVILGSPATLDGSRSGSDLVLKYGTGLADQVTVAGHFSGAGNVETLSIVGGPFAGTYNLNNDSSSPVDGGNGNDLLVGALGATAETFNGNDGNDLVFAQGGNDTANGGNGNDRIFGQDGADVLNGDANNDTLVGGAAADSLNGGTGNDTLTGDVDGAVDTLNGGDGNDTFIIDEAGDVVVEAAAQGTDTVQASVTYTITDADVENLTLTGSAGINGTGNASNNLLTGNSGNNQLVGLGGNDTLVGGAGSDDLQGGANDDTYRFSAGHGTDTITEVSGSDTVEFTGNVGYLDFQTDGTNLIIKYGNNTATDQVTVNGNAVETATINLDPYSGSYTISADVSGDVTGTGASEVIAGRSGNNNINGGDGSDLIFGGDGNDTISGGTGGDTDLLVGGAGNDTYDVGDGDDIIYITSALDGKDIVNNFDNTDSGPGGQDFIDLDQLFDSLGVASGSRDARVDISTSGANTLVKVDIDGGGGFNDAGDLLITINGVNSGISKGTGADDVQLGTL